LSDHDVNILEDPNMEKQCFKWMAEQHQGNARDIVVKDVSFLVEKMKVLSADRNSAF